MQEEIEPSSSGMSWRGLSRTAWMLNTLLPQLLLQPVLVLVLLALLSASMVISCVTAGSWRMACVQGGTLAINILAYTGLAARACACGSPWRSLK